MKKIFPLVALTAITALSLVTSPVNAAKPSGGNSTTTPLGIDVGWPQCGKALPTTQAFGIVGVNDGLATTTNPCLAEQLVWASKSVGGTKQPPVQLYVNTANPGGLNTESWPKTGTNTYGTCDGTDSLACAWQYGWNRAYENVNERFMSAAQSAGIDTNAAAYTWWLDVETENTWKALGADSFAAESNVAVLEGMRAYYGSLGAKVGLYSTAYQWGQIVGNSVTSASNLNGLDNWRPGGTSLRNAQQACTAKPLTAGGVVTLTQFISGRLDYDYSCKG